MNDRRKQPTLPATAQIEKSLLAGEALRCDLGGGARLHIDRQLPFLVIHRLGRSTEAARAIAAANASYLLFRNQAQAKAIIAQVGKAMREKFGFFLVVEVAELEKDNLAEDAAYLPPFEIELACSQDGPAQTACRAVGAAIEAIDVKFRRPQLAQTDLGRKGGRPRLVERLTDHPALHVLFAPIYRAPDGKSLYPDLRERVIANLVDAILQGIAAFARETGSMKPASHRALGRRLFIDAVNRADAAIDEIAQSFDFLLAVTPINAMPAYEQFSRDGYRHAPRFLYRPLTVSLARQKRALYTIDLDRFEDPILSELYAQKRQELDLQLTMIAARETPRFRELGRALYGAVEPALLREAEQILDHCPPKKAQPGKQLGSDAVRKRANAMIAGYVEAYPGFDATVELRDDLPSGLMVSGARLLISQQMSIPAGRVEALLCHEVGVHLLTYFNGSAQGLRLFRSGLAGYEGLQEGLAVLAEYLVGGMTSARLRLIAARVVGCAMMLDGASFSETFAAMNGKYGFAPQTAFTLVLRVYRGGGLAKDAIYLRGLLEILAHLETGGELDPFWIGKVAVSHFPIVQELGSRGLLKAPRLLPGFLNHKGAQQRLEQARSGLSPINLVNA